MPRLEQTSLPRRKYVRRSQPTEARVRNRTRALTSAWKSDKSSVKKDAPFTGGRQRCTAADGDKNERLLHAFKTKLPGSRSACTQRKPRADAGCCRKIQRLKRMMTTSNSVLLNRFRSKCNLNVFFVTKLTRTDSRSTVSRTIAATAPQPNQRSTPWTRPSRRPEPVTTSILKTNKLKSWSNMYHKKHS